MNNPITNRLRLIEVVPCKGISLLGNLTISWLGQVIPEIKGISQEIYRGEQRIGSVVHHHDASKDTDEIDYRPIKGFKGDIIYCVLTTPQPDRFTGLIITKDGYYQEYEVNYQLLVVDSRKCVECFRNNTDPAAMIIKEFREKSEEFFSRFTYDEIEQQKAGIINVEELIKYISNICGITIKSYNWKVHLDRQKEQEYDVNQNIRLKKEEIDNEIELKIYELQKQAEFKESELRLNSELVLDEEDLRRERERRQKQFDRDEKMRQNIFDRDEKMKQNIFVRDDKLKTRLNEVHIRFLDETVKDLLAINGEKIRDAVDSNTPLTTILEDSLKLLTVFTDQKLIKKEVIDSTLINDDFTSDTN